MDGYHTPPTLADHLTLEQRILDLEALVGRLQARMEDAEHRLDAVDPGAESIDATAHVGALTRLREARMDLHRNGGGNLLRALSP